MNSENTAFFCWFNIKTFILYIPVAHAIAFFCGGAWRLIQTKNPCKSIYYYSTEATTNSQSGIICVHVFIASIWNYMYNRLAFYKLCVSFYGMVSNDFIENVLLQIIADKNCESFGKWWGFDIMPEWIISQNKSISVQFKQLIDLFSCNRKNALTNVKTEFMLFMWNLSSRIGG